MTLDDEQRATVVQVRLVNARQALDDDVEAAVSEARRFVKEIESHLQTTDNRLLAPSPAPRT